MSQIHVSAGNNKKALEMQIYQKLCMVLCFKCFGAAVKEDFGSSRVTFHAFPRIKAYICTALYHKLQHYFTILPQGPEGTMTSRG